jgi:hypothetical protein
MTPMPMMRVRPAVPATPPTPPGEPDSIDEISDLHFEIGPQIEAALREAGLQLERVRPQLERMMRDLPNTLQTIKVPTVYVDVVV